VTAPDSESTVALAARRYIEDGIDSVPGWFGKLDARLMVHTHEAQRACGSHGSILEIGAFNGRSAILLGFLCDVPGERMIVSDLFAVDEVNEESKSWRPQGIPKPTRDDFVRHYLRFHDALPEIIAGASRDLDPNQLGCEQFRMVHVDGAHDWVSVDADLRLARALAGEGAVLVFDDVGVASYPAVGARVWSEVLSGGLHPVAVTTKLYATVDPGSPVAEALRSRIEREPDLLAVAQTVGNTKVLVVSERRSTDESSYPAKRPSWKRVAQQLSPPVVYRGASHLASAVRELRRRAKLVSRSRLPSG
jgi:hypothetical protein